MSISRKNWLALTAAFVAFSAQAGSYKANELIIKYKDGVRRTHSESNSLYMNSGVKNVYRYTGSMQGFEHIKIWDKVSMQQAIERISSDPTVEYVQPNYIVHTFKNRSRDDGDQPGMPGGLPCIPGFDIPGCDKDAPMPCLIPGIPFPPGCQDGGENPPEPGNPNQPPADRPALADAPADVVPPVADPDLSKAYGVSKVGAVEAWKSFRGSKDFIVADIDTGIDYNHPDLAFNVWRNPNPSAKKDIAGYDFVHDDGLPYDDNKHGTHTAGTIGAVGGNGAGISGVTQRVSIMGLKFLSGEGSGTTADAIKAIDYAIEHGAKVLSNSWGGKGDDGNKALYDAIERARAKDVLFVAAAGNDGTDNDGKNPSYPAAFDNDNMLSVAATDANDKLAFFSNYGKKTTHVAAPGVKVYSTVPGGKYENLDGTSMACPHVAGAAALIWSKNPKWTYKQVKKALMDTVDPIAALKGKTVTGGRINVLSALSVK